MRTGRRRAFTLLETLLAAATAVALVSLVAAAMAQARRWTQQRSPAVEALQLVRVQALLRDQLQRAAVVGASGAATRGEKPKATALLDAETLRVYTGVSALHDDAAIVEATYRLREQERSLLVGAKQRPKVSLVLTERVVRSPAQPAVRSEAGDATRVAQEDVRSRTLLEDCEELSWWTLTSAQGGPAQRSQASRRAAAPPPRRWSPAAQEDRALAVRTAQLRGVCDGQEFEWTVHVEALRSF
ncbi:MAG: hypothetical protein D6824_00625 [Planctomycetota bacterium]|nr:MAG: hypothetical protein D6824_00625 [Planctomycetota bacterium]